MTEIFIPGNSHRIARFGTAPIFFITRRRDNVQALIQGVTATDLQADLQALNQVPPCNRGAMDYDALCERYMAAQGV